jgi:hypothetical protein
MFTKPNQMKDVFSVDEVGLDVLTEDDLALVAGGQIVVPEMQINVPQQTCSVGFMHLMDFRLHNGA